MNPIMHMLNFCGISNPNQQLSSGHQKQTRKKKQRLTLRNTVMVEEGITSP